MEGSSCPFGILDDRSEWAALLSFEDMLDKTPQTQDPSNPTLARSDSVEVDETRAGHAVVDRIVQSFTQKLDKASGSSQNLPLDTPICTANHESKLLMEPHDQPLPDGKIAKMRPCICGDACLGFHESIRDRDMCGGGCALREMLFPDELQRFETTGKLPTQQKACVLCHRQQTLQAYLLCQGSTEEVGTKFADMHVNLYVNPRDCLDGYASENTIPFETHGWSYLVGPVAVNRFSKYRWVRRGNVWCVDQTELLWQNF